MTAIVDRALTPSERGYATPIRAGRRADRADRGDGDDRIDASIVAALLRKDFLAARRSKATVIPMLVVPFVLLVVLPAGIGWYARTATSPDLSGLLARIPGHLARELSALSPAQQMVQLVLGYLIAPLFLVVPRTASAALAADSFAGEKERRTLESLLHLPVRDRELYVAKVLFAFIPAVALSWIGFVLFAVTANLVAWPVMGRVFVPTLKWFGLVGLIAPGVAALGLGVMVRVSARCATTQEANQLGGAVIMPLILTTVGQTTGLLMLAPQWILVAAAAIWAVAITLVVRGMRRFSRDRVASRL